MDKEHKAPNTTITYNRNEIETPAGNIYRAISIVAKRSEQINSEVRKELLDKLEEFAMPGSDNLEEIFDNKEQIEVSRYYESLPKPHSIALQEWLEGKIYYRDTTPDSNDLL